MDNSLLNEIEQKKAELAEKEIELSLLEQEFACVQDKNYQVKFIENALASQYAEFQKANPINREQESEIERTLKEKEQAIRKALNAYADSVNSARKKKDDRFKRRHEYRREEGYIFGESFAQRQKRQEKLSRERAKQDKEDEKIFNNSCKTATKACIDELKRLFGEIEIDIKRFYKNGISKENLTKLVSVMDKICVEGAKIGTIPLSYQQKVYKWQQTAKDMLVDMEKTNQNREKVKKQALVSKRDFVQSEINETKKRIRDLQLTQENAERALAKLKSDLEKSESNYKHNRDAIRANCDQKKREAQDFCNANVRELQAECESMKEDIQAHIKSLQQEIDLSRSSHEQLLKEKQKIDEELVRTFVLSFGKKKSLRDRSAELGASAASLANAILSLQQELSDEMKLSPEQDYDAAINAERQELARTINEVDTDTAARLSELDESLIQKREAFNGAKNTINVAKEEISRRSETLKAKEKELLQVNASIADFHADYIITTYGKSVGLQSVISEKKDRIATVSAEIKSLNKEIALLEKEAARVEKELLREREEQRKAQLKKVKEEELLRKAQQERQERIQKELLEREAEQSVISKTANSLAHISAIIQELENDSNHRLLQESNCPLADDGKRIITNSIVRKQYVQAKETPDCKRYALLFVDRTGQAISDQRLVEKKAIGEKTTTSFELKSEDGFDSENYYLLIMNFDTSEVACAQKYRINIAFSNDFDF